MLQNTDYLNMVHDINFTGLQGNLLHFTGDQRSNINLVNSKANLRYFMLTNKGDLDSLGYYTNTAHPYSQLPTNGSPALNSIQKDIIQDILKGSPSDHYSVTFSDVSQITFTAGGSSNSEIIFGQITGGDPDHAAQTGAIINSENNGTIKPLQHADIFFYDSLDQDQNSVSDWFSTDKGTFSYYGVMHEIGHALGIDHPVNDRQTQVQTDIMTPLNTTQYSIMSNQVMGGMNSSDGSITTTVTPVGLQLLDIAAVQAIYGTNWDTRNEFYTQYSKATAFKSSRPNDAFVYTIWDGGGTGDTIDASGYSDGVVINLNQGAFSSIGKSADASFASTRVGGIDVTGLAKDNVAIAYKTEIENAIGTVGNDHIIGNDLDNVIVVGAGTDTVVGHDGVDTLDYHDDQTGNGMSVSIAENNGPTSGTIVDGWGDTDYFADIENFILTKGDDTVDVIQTGIIATDSIFDGGDGHDKYTNSTGILEIKDDELWVWDEFGHTHDVLRHFEELAVDKAIASSVATTTFTTLLAAGSSFTDVDYRDIVGALTFDVSNGALHVTGGGITHNYLNGDAVNVVGNNGDNTYNVTGITKNIYTGTSDDSVVVNNGASNVRIH